MTGWRGVDVMLTPVADVPGVSEYQLNTRMKTEGELQRRWGYQSSSIAQQAGRVLNIVSAYVAGGNYLTFDLGNASGPLGEVGGFVTPVPPIDGPKWRKPIVIAGTPAAPVIVAVTPSPTSPRPYQAGVVTFTPTITYDGLSGALSYSWTIGGPAAPIPNTSTAAIFVTNFDGFCIPGNYNGNCGISTQFNGFTASLPFTFVVS